MKSVLISIRPEWCQLILDRYKTVEIRKTRPKTNIPFKCYIYCTLPKRYGDAFLVGKSPRIANGKVIGEFTCSDIEELKPNAVFNVAALTYGACVTKDEFLNYIGNKTAYFWHISDLVIYDKPKELSEFHQCHTCEYAGCCNDTCWKPLKRPPQSWCYVKSEVEDNE